MNADELAWMRRLVAVARAARDSYGCSIETSEGRRRIHELGMRLDSLQPGDLNDVQELVTVCERCNGAGGTSKTNAYGMGAWFVCAMCNGEGKVKV